jgi:hypothetical protein
VANVVIRVSDDGTAQVNGAPAVSVDGTRIDPSTLSCSASHLNTKGGNSCPITVSVYCDDGTQAAARPSVVFALDVDESGSLPVDPSSGFVYGVTATHQCGGTLAGTRSP